MIATTLWICWLGLWRDRAAFLLTFVLPPLLFLAFAAIFSNAPGHDIKLKLAVADLVHTPATGRLTLALKNASALRVIELEHGTAADVADLVHRGNADAGLVVDADPAARSIDPPLEIVEAPDRPLAASMALGQVQRVVAEALPDVLLARILDDLQDSKAIDADDRAFLDKAFAKKADTGSTEHFSFSKLGVIRPLPATAGQSNGGVLQYAAAVSAIFLLFGAVQGAYGLIDERENGLADRLRLAAGGLTLSLAGRMAFLVMQGTAQVSLVYLTAFIAYGAGFPSIFLAKWLLAGVVAAAACAGMALLACSLSRTRRQAELCTTFSVLLLSAVGGSMVPSYLMPGWLQSAGWWTPNAWIMHSLGQSILPGGDPNGFASSVVVLCAIAMATFALTLTVA